MVNFHKFYYVKNNKIIQRKSTDKVVITTSPSYINPDPRNKNYNEYCKYQLMAYYPFKNSLYEMLEI